MKPFLKLVKTGTEGTNHTLALVREVTVDTAKDNLFGKPDQAVQVVICDSVTGENISEELITLSDLSVTTSIKIDGKVTKLTPAIRTGIGYSETQLISLGEYELLNEDVEVNKTLLMDETYKEFRQHSLGAFGLSVSGDSADLYGILQVYDGQKHILVTGQAG